MLNVLEGTPKGKTKRECNSQEKKKKKANVLILLEQVNRSD